MKRGGGGEFWRRGEKDESLKTGGQERGEVFLIIIPPPKKNKKKQNKKSVSNLGATQSSDKLNTVLLEKMSCAAVKIYFIIILYILIRYILGCLGSAFVTLIWIAPPTLKSNWSKIRLRMQ